MTANASQGTTGGDELRPVKQPALPVLELRPAHERAEAAEKLRASRDRRWAEDAPEWTI